MEGWIEHVRERNEHLGNRRRFCPKIFKSLGTFARLRRAFFLVAPVAFIQRLGWICSTPRSCLLNASATDTHRDEKGSPCTTDTIWRRIKGNEKELRNTNNNLNLYLQ